MMFRELDGATNELRAQWGSAGIRAADPDHGDSDRETSLSDALANMMHAADAAGVSFAAALDTARRHYVAECREGVTA